MEVHESPLVPHLSSCAHCFYISEMHYCRPQYFETTAGICLREPLEEVVEKPEVANVAVWAE